MKKFIILITLIFLIVMTGCNNDEKINKTSEGNTKVVYCDSCGAESKDVTKFCSECGSEAKWVAEKPKIENDPEEKQDNAKKEEKATEEDKKTPEEEKEELDVEKQGEQDVQEQQVQQESNVDYAQCMLCGKEEVASNMGHVHGYGYVHDSCYENAEKCKDCNKSLLPGDDDNGDGICWFCEN